jgi:uncharacterized membrane protein (DUF2068 family)
MRWLADAFSMRRRKAQMAEFNNADDSDDPYRAIRIGDPGSVGEATKWGLLLTRFMRLIAAFWLIQGLAQWRVVLVSTQSIFDTMPQPAAVAVVFFGVADLIAGVGLWLATPWGGVLWLLIASAQIFVAAGMPNFFAGGYYLIAVDLVLIALYFVLTFEAGRDFEAKRVIDQRHRRRASVLRQTGGPHQDTLGAMLMRHLAALPFLSPRPRARKTEASLPPEPLKPRSPSPSPAAPANAPPPPAAAATSKPAPTPQPDGAKASKAAGSAPADSGQKRFAGLLQPAAKPPGAPPPQGESMPSDPAKGDRKDS